MIMRGSLHCSMQAGVFLLLLGNLELVFIRAGCFHVARQDVLLLLLG